MFGRFLSMGIAALSCWPMVCSADERQLPLTGAVKTQIDAIVASFSDMAGLTDLKRENDVLGEVRLYSLPPLHALAILQNKMPSLHGMPALIYQAIGHIDENHLWGVVVSGGYAAIRGLIWHNFTYRQFGLTGDLLFGQQFGDVTLLGGLGTGQTRGEVAGNFLVEDEMSHIDFSTSIPHARAVVLWRSIPLQCEWMMQAPHSETKLQLGEQGSHFYSSDTTPWGTGSSQLSVTLPFGGGVIGMGYIHDRAHADFYRLSFAIDMVHW